MPQIVCDSIDRLITVEMEGKGWPRGTIVKLYNAARERLGNKALTYLAATALMQAAKKSKPIIISTGFKFGSFVPLGETDGPPGAAALARTLSMCLKLPIILITEEDLIDGTGNVIEAIGLNFKKNTKKLTASTDVGIIGFTTDAELAQEEARKLIEEIDPCAVITTEKIGPGKKGVYHSALGTDISAEQAKVDSIVEEAKNRKILTIGIGDIGNEIGFGLIFDVARHIVPLGIDCGCPCHSGIITVTATDILLPCMTSNWGAYGISAALAVLNKNIDLLHTPRDEHRMIMACLNSGAIDGGTGKPTLGVDGIDLDIHMHMVAMLREIVRIGLLPEFSRGF